VTEHVFRCRKYQRPLHEAWVSGRRRRLLQIAHRRWGKDEVALNASRDLALQRPASYWHCLPEYAQARKAIWTAVNPHTGRRRIDDAFPAEIRAATNEQEMFIKLANGSTWQIVGSDRYDSLVGSGVAGVVFSEWALANPASWAYVRPMVAENNGWAAFITTPRGNNHAKSMLDMARARDDEWFANVSDVDATGALTREQLDGALAEYQALYGIDFGRAYFEQEYMCSFAGAMVGAYFGAEVAKAERDGRIAVVDVDPDRPVHTAWDLGRASNNPIWCFQVAGTELRVVDFYQPESDDIEEWCAALNARGYHGTDYVPHDILTTDWGSKHTRIEVLRRLGRKPRRIAKVSVADGLQAGRTAINAARFNAEKCAVGIDGLKNYRREWDDGLKTFRETPVKDWSEHIGSAWRYLGLAWRDEKPVVVKKVPPKQHILSVAPDGRMRSNLTIQEQIDDMVRRKRRLAE